MARLSSPSDFTSINPNYSIGNGFYTTHTDISNLLQISAFSASTTPNLVEVGKIIKNVEGQIDNTIGITYRPIIYKDEFYSFESTRKGAYPIQTYKDYVGFIQLDQPKIQKIIRLEVWQGNSYKDLASATAKITMPSNVTNSVWTINLVAGSYTFSILGGTSTTKDFYDNFGPKTTASQLVDAINEVFPAKTAKFTGEVSAKSVTANGWYDAGGNPVSGANIHISDFFYATVDSEDSSTVIISSLLLGDDGQNCTITSTNSGNSTVGEVTGFKDNENSSRTGDFWQIGNEGKIFFLKNYPYLQNHSVRVTYVSGDGRVDSSIHEAATKLSAASILLHDDNSILIAETGSNIDLKTKHDILIEQATSILDGKKKMIHFIS